jgi:hypothetical protein
MIGNKPVGINSEATLYRTISIYILLQGGEMNNSEPIRFLFNPNLVTELFIQHLREWEGKNRDPGQINPTVLGLNWSHSVLG